jgi:Na+-transporting methylmalonyl-CoA/oxaloacetate decarboxylase gamma subunit
MAEWSSAGVVAITGVVSVFAVLTLLSLTVTATGKVFEYNAKRNKAKQSETGAHR